MRISHHRATSGAPGSAREPELVLPSPAHAHQVQFYESESYLTSAVTDFLAGGLTVGQSLVVIATDTHRAAFSKQLKAEGFDVDAAVARGQIALVDARSLLDTFMVGGSPDPQRFRDHVGALLELARTRGGRTNVLRLYGEMVDVLWRDGNSDAALRVEELWNDLASTYEFQLLCAYAMGNFYKASDSEHFQAICRHHTHVVPTERYVEADAEGRLLEITLLQQRARSLEAEIEHRKELEHRLREVLADRDRLLAAERAARLEAESASRAKSQFLAVMSHELRTPLNAIAGHVQLLEMGVYGAANEAQRDALERIERSQRRLLRLVNDVLNLARVESGRVEYQIEDVAVQSVVNDLWSIVQSQLEAKALQSELRLPHTPLMVRADGEKLGQVLLNLLTNAIKFTPAGGRITVGAGAGADPLEVVIRVTDTGIGIPPAKLEAIFEPFVQVHVGPTRPVDGAGLGLAISRDLARGMGGDLVVQSAEGVGSTFEVRLKKGR